MAAARSSAAGDDLDAVEAAARSAVPRGRAFIVVHRLDNLRRSGRIGTAASWLGTALSLKPLLCLDVDGRLVLSQRIRTLSKAHAAMVEAVAEFVGDARASIVVHHVDNHDDADEVGAALTTRLPQVESLSVTRHGPGAVGARRRRRDRRVRDGGRLVMTLDLARDERLEFADFLAGLTPEQWDAPSLCAGWTVRDVAAHCVSFEGMSGGQLAARFLKGRLQTDRINALGVADLAGASTDELIALLRDNAEPHGLGAGFGGRVALTDNMIHQQDIRRPLGIARTIPPSA